MTYDDLLRVTRTTTGPPAPDSGWGVSTGSAADGTSATAVLYDGPADVQNGTRTLKLLADAGAPLGEREAANAAVYLPPAAASAFALFRVGDAVETTLGAGTLTGLRHTDGALTVRLTLSAAAVPDILV